MQLDSAFVRDKLRDCGRGTEGGDGHGKAKHREDASADNQERAGAGEGGGEKSVDEITRELVRRL